MHAHKHDAYMHACMHVCACIAYKCMCFMPLCIHSYAGMSMNLIQVQLAIQMSLAPAEDGGCDRAVSGQVDVSDRQS